jgi:hypothetical protein
MSAAGACARWRSHPAYPVGYHTGSVWPHDSALIAFGLRRYGFDEDFLLVFEGLLEAASRFNDYRLPELFGGFAREEFDEPVPYPVACQPQAWSAGSIPFLLKWGLGISPDALQKRLRIIRPSLPRWLGRVDVTGLQIGNARVDLRFERAGEHVTLTDARIEGDMEVVLEIAPDRRRIVDPNEILRAPAPGQEALSWDPDRPDVPDRLACGAAPAPARDAANRRALPRRAGVRPGAGRLRSAERGDGLEARAAGGQAMRSGHPEPEDPAGSTVAVRRVEVRSAYMGLAEGGADFLDEGPGGGAYRRGCEPVAADRPYECELEG